jgi:hypothetical protein
MRASEIACTARMIKINSRGAAAIATGRPSRLEFHPVWEVFRISKSIPNKNRAGAAARQLPQAISRRSKHGNFPEVRTDHHSFQHNDSAGTPIGSVHVRRNRRRDAGRRALVFRGGARRR